MLGYNIRIKTSNKTYVGVTSEEMSIAAKIKTSLTKDDEGEEQKEVIGHDITLKVAGIMDVGSSTQLNNDDIMELAQAKGSSASVDVEYVRGSGDTYEGTGVITGYTESSPADGDATYSLDIAISGELTKKTSSSQL